MYMPTASTMTTLRKPNRRLMGPPCGPLHRETQPLTSNQRVRKLRSSQCTVFSITCSRVAFPRKRQVVSLCSAEQPRRVFPHGTLTIAIYLDWAARSESDVAFLLPDIPISADGLKHGFGGVVQPFSFLFGEMAEDGFAGGWSAEMDVGGFPSHGVEQAEFGVGATQGR